MAEATTLSSQLSPEEHDYLTQMVKSPGWRILMEKLVLPELLRVSRHVDNATASERDTQLYRGAKLTLTRIMQTIYHWARLPNPLEEHYQALLSSLRQYTEDYVPPDSAYLHPQQGPTPPPVQVPSVLSSRRVSRRVSRPVL